MAKRRLYTSRRRRARGSGGTLMIAVGMILIFAAVAWMKGGRPALISPSASPLPTSALTPVSDTLRLEAQDYYAIQFGVYESASAAAQKAADYVERGAAGYVWQDGQTYRVLAAVYTSLGDAQTIKERLSTQEIDAYIYTIHQEALELRIAAGDEQRALLARVFAFLTRAQREMADVSMALDQSTMSIEEAGERMELLYGQTQTLLEEIRTMLLSDEAGVIDKLRALLAQIMDDCANIFSQNSQEVVEMTAKIKYNYLDVLWNVTRFVQEVLMLGAV